MLRAMALRVLKFALAATFLSHSATTEPEHVDRRPTPPGPIIRAELELELAQGQEVEQSAHVDDGAKVTHAAATDPKILGHFVGVLRKASLALFGDVLSQVASQKPGHFTSRQGSTPRATLPVLVLHEPMAPKLSHDVMGDENGRQSQVDVVATSGVIAPAVLAPTTLMKLKHS